MSYTLTVVCQCCCRKLVRFFFFFTLFGLKQTLHGHSRTDKQLIRRLIVGKSISNFKAQVSEKTLSLLRLSPLYLEKHVLLMLFSSHLSDYSGLMETLCSYFIYKSSYSPMMGKKKRTRGQLSNSAIPNKSINW